MLCFSASRSTTPAGGDDQTVDTADYAYLAVTAGDGATTGVVAELAKVGTAFAVGTKPIDNGTAKDDYTVNLTNNSVTYSVSNDGVSGLAKTYTTITVNGTDVTSAADKAKGETKTIVLTGYTIDFSIDNPDASLTGNLEPITGKMSGEMIGLIEVSKLVKGEIGNETTVEVKAITDTYYKSGLATTIKPSAVIAFYPAEATDVDSLTYLGNPVTDKQAFVDYLNSARVNTKADDYTASSTASTSLAAYKKAVKDAYSADVWNDLKTNMRDLAASGLSSIMISDTAAGDLTRETVFNNAEGTSTAVITLKNTTASVMEFTAEGSDAGDIVYALAPQGSVVITLSGNTTGPTSFSASDYKIAGTLQVYAYTDGTFGDNENSDYASVEIKDLAGKLKTAIAVERGATQNEDKTYVVADITAIDFSGAVTGGSIETVIDANVLPGVAGEGSTTDPYTLTAYGALSVDCAKVGK